MSRTFITGVQFVVCTRDRHHKACVCFLCRRKTCDTELACGRETTVNTCSCSFCMVRSFPRMALSCTIRLCSSSMLSSSSLPMRYCSFISWFLSSPVICRRRTKAKSVNSPSVLTSETKSCLLQIWPKLSVGCLTVDRDTSHVPIYATMDNAVYPNSESAAAGINYALLYRTRNRYIYI